MRNLFAAILMFLLLVMPEHAFGQIVTKGIYAPSKDGAAMLAFTKGVKAYNARSFRTALGHFQKATHHHKMFVDAYDHTGMCYEHLGKIDSAEAVLKKSLEVFSKGVTARQRLGNLYAGKKDYKKALKMFDEMKELDKTNPEGFFGSARVRLITGDFEVADQDAMKALEMYRKDNHSYMNQTNLLLGMICYYKKDMTRSRKYFSEAKKKGMRIPQKIADELGI